MLFEDLIITIIGLRISSNDTVSQPVISLLLLGSICMLWLISVGLGIESVVQKYDEVRKVGKFGVVGVLFCLAGLISAPKVLILADDTGKLLYAQIGEIVAASIACLIWEGKLKLWVRTACCRVLRVFRMAFTHDERMTTESTSSSRVGILPQSMQTTTVTVMSSSTSLPMLAFIRKAISDVISAASGAQQVLPSITTCTSTEHTCEIVLYHFTSSDPPSTPPTYPPSSRSSSSSSSPKSTSATA